MVHDFKKLAGTRKAKLPAFVAPQLATLVKEPPAGDLWLHELKFDGYRMLCRIDRGKVTVWSRNEKEWTGKFANVEESVKALPLTTAILDGEIVIVDAHRQSSFQKLQRAMVKSVNSGSVEWAASHPSYIQAHKGAHNCSKRRECDAIRPASLRITGSF